MLVGRECLLDEVLVAVKFERSEHNFFCLVFQRPPDLYID